MQQEIEVKVKIKDEQLIQLKQWLSNNGKFEGTVVHYECYLDNPTVPLTFTSKEGYKDARFYLRVRKSPEKGDTICLKKFYYDKNTGKTTHCDEWEVEVNNGETALQLLNALGFSDATVIQKERSIYRVSSFEVVIDSVKDLGVFVEVELKEPVDDVQLGLKRIYDLLMQAGITSFRKQERGYVSMAWNPDYDFGEQMNLQG